MTEEQSIPLAAALREMRLTTREYVDFLAYDTETIQANVRFLTAAAMYFNAIAVVRYGGPGGSVRGEGLVEQAMAAAFQTFGGEDPYPEPFRKAAVLLRGITQGHPFNDGNKRTGFLVAAYYLDVIDHTLPDPLSSEEAISLCLRVSAGEVRDVDVIAAELERLWSR